MLNTIFSTVDAIEQHVATADLVIGAVLVPGAAAPKLITRAMLARMRPGSVFVDIAIDQGGCAETSRPTTPRRPDLCRGGRDPLLRHQHAGRGAAHLHLRPQQRHPAVRAGAGRQGLAQGDAQDDPHLANGVNVAQGKLTSEAVAASLDLTYTPLKQAAGLIDRSGDFRAEVARTPLSLPLMWVRDQC